MAAGEVAFDPTSAKAFDPRSVAAGAEPFTSGAVEDIAKTAKDFVSQREPGIDYYQGVDQALFRAGFSRMSNDDEKTGFLEKQVGRGNFGKDTFGAWFIAPKGLKKLGINSDMPISIDEQRITGYDAADLAGDVPAIIGASGMALTASGVGALGGIALTVLGAAGGKAYDEVLKILQGYNKKSPGQMATTLTKEAGAAAIGEGAFRIGGRLLKGYSPGNTPERIALTKEAMDAGLTPKTYQFIDAGGPLLKRFQATSENVLGDPSQAANREALLGMAGSLQNRAGQTAVTVPGGGVEPILKPPVTDVGERLVGTVKKTVDKAQLQIDYVRNRANTALDKSLKNIESQLGSADPRTGQAVVDSIKQARREFGNNASELYTKIDDLIGAPFVPTAALKAQAEKIGAQLPKTADGRVVFTESGEANPIADIAALPEQITIRQAQRIRSMLGESSLTRDLVSGVDKRDLALLKEASEKMFDEAGTSLGYAIRSQVLGPDGKPLTIIKINGSKAQLAIQALKEADAFYKQGIRKFDFPMISAITRDARMSGSVNPEQVIDYIIKPGHVADVERVKKLIGPVWEKVTAAHFDGMIAKSSNLVNGEEQIVGKRLFDNIKTMGKTFEAVYGKNAPAIKRYASELAARDGKIDPATLTGNVAVDMQAAAVRQRTLDVFMKDNYLAALARPGQEAEQAAAFIFRPNSPLRVLEAKKFYGETSEEFTGLQQQAMQKILSAFVEKADDPLVKVLNGKQLRAEMDRYGRKTLEATFGADLTNDLYKFANVSEFVTKKGPMGAGGIVAANVALHPVNNIGKIIDFAIAARLLRKPGVIKWLAEGISPDTPPKKAAAALARVSTLAAALGGDETGSATLNTPP